MAVRLFVGAFVVAAALAAMATDVVAADDGRYQFMKATENRVWRLDRQSGEIAVCTLNGPQLTCTTSSDAVMPPKKSYAQAQAEKKKSADKQHDKDLQILERIMAFFKELMTLAKEDK